MSDRLKLQIGDLTQIQVDAIVNAANSVLEIGGGVDGAIHRKAGPNLYKAVQEQKALHCPEGLQFGQAVITPAFNLPSRHVIFVAGPVFSAMTPEEADKNLEATYWGALNMAEQHGCKSIAFPAISTGIYGFPMERAAPIVMKVMEHALRTLHFEEIHLIFFNREQHDVFFHAAGIHHV
jgi:O-acetyl-ADP-ribose deacetylase